LARCGRFLKAQKKILNGLSSRSFPAKEDGRFAKAAGAPIDFAANGKFEYPTSNGKYVIDYSGFPRISFEAE
jgi:hypothetical protein